MSASVTQPIRVAVVDDQLLIRAGLRTIIDSQQDMAVVAEAEDGVAGAALATGEDAPDVVLMDIRMRGGDGLRATEQITAHGPWPRVIVLTTFDSEDNLLAAIRGGASGFLLKGAEPEAMLEAIRTVHAGDAVIAPQATRRLLAHIRPPADTTGKTPALPDPLTPREFEVLRAIGLGWSNAEICQRLVVSEATVKTHVGRVLAKTGSRDRVQAALYAVASGAVRVGEL